MKIGVFAINSTASFEYFFIEILIYNNLIYNLLENVINWNFRISRSRTTNPHTTVKEYT